MWAGQPEAPGLTGITSHLILAVGGSLNIFLHACTPGLVGQVLQAVKPLRKGSSAEYPALVRGRRGHSPWAPALELAPFILGSFTGFQLSFPP